MQSRALAESVASTATRNGLLEYLYLCVQTIRDNFFYPVPIAKVRTHIQGSAFEVLHGERKFRQSFFLSFFNLFAFISDVWTLRYSPAIRRISFCLARVNCRAIERAITRCGMHTYVTPERNQSKRDDGFEEDSSAISSRSNTRFPTPTGSRSSLISFLLLFSFHYIYIQVKVIRHHLFVATILPDHKIKKPRLR